MYACLYDSMYVWECSMIVCTMYVCMHVCIYVCMYVCVIVCIILLIISFQSFAIHHINIYIYVHTLPPLYVYVLSLSLSIYIYTYIYHISYIYIYLVMIYNLWAMSLWVREKKKKSMQVSSDTYFTKLLTHFYVCIEKKVGTRTQEALGHPLCSLKSLATSELFTRKSIYNARSSSLIYKIGQICKQMRAKLYKKKPSLHTNVPPCKKKQTNKQITITVDLTIACMYRHV